MQIDPREVFDLLKLLGMGAAWGVEGNFLRYFEELRQPFEDVDWSFRPPHPCSTITSRLAVPGTNSSVVLPSSGLVP